VEVYTIGFTRRSARGFFETLRAAGVRRLLDVRLHNTSHLAGFSKRDDLAYFLDAILGAEYVHEPALAPTEELLAAYRGRGIDWDGYARAFLGLLDARRVARSLSPGLLGGPTAILCSEPTAERCHRRLVVEYLAEAWGGITPVHL
jgi:uncharacterized protein (DUF488 family)